MNKFFALCVIATLLFSCDCPLMATELVPLETIKLYDVTEFPGQVRLADTRDEKGQFQGGITAEVFGSINKKGSPKEHNMHYNISLDESDQNTAFEVGKRPLLREMIVPIEVDYRFQQGVIYPMPFGELYRVADLTRSDESGNYAVLKRVTRKDLGIDTPVDYSRQYIPTNSLDFPAGRGTLNSEYCRFQYAEETNSYTKKLETVLKCSLSYPKVIPSDEELFPIMGSMTVAEGNILPVVDCGFKILKIVPPNVEKKVCGWVEIDPRPILLRTPLGRQLEKLEQQEKQKAAPQPRLAPIPEPKP